MLKESVDPLGTQRCQNHGPVRLLVPLLEFNLKGAIFDVEDSAFGFVSFRTAPTIHFRGLSIGH